MNKKFTTVFLTIVALLIILFAMGPFYILNEGQQAVVIRFGKIVDAQQQAGLKLKVPFIDNVVKYSKRILSWDGRAQGQDRIPTKEQLFIWVDVTARWKITDPMQFYAAVTSMDNAQNRLNEIIHSSVRTVISNNMLREAVRSSNLINELTTTTKIAVEAEDAIIQRELEELERGQDSTKQERIEKGREVLSTEIFGAVSAVTHQFGITLIDIIIRQIRYSDDLTESVYNRMIKDRNQVAQIYRSAGEGQKAEWLGKLQNEQKTILSQAYKTAEEIKGRADATAAKTYADSYSKDSDFFEFWRSIESYRKTIPKFNKTITTEMEYFKYLDRQSPR
ncbi:MAG: protease modulator HflC [Spirochaetaceae bacterium]|nr:protease modulator HflC [Spirochaetaceae bacterium]